MPKPKPDDEKPKPDDEENAIDLEQDLGTRPAEPLDTDSNDVPAADANLNFEPETVALMGHVCDEAWSKLQASATRPTPAQEQALRSDLAQRVMAAVVDGERDPVQLLRKALNGAG